MSAHNAPIDLHSNHLMQPDPGASGTITVAKNPCYVGLVSAAAESRTLARPTQAGVLLMLAMETDGGDITLTVTGGYNEAGDTTFTFSDPGQQLVLHSIKFGGAYYWRAISNYGHGNLSPTEANILTGVTASTDELNILTGVTATATEINRACDTSGRVVAHGSGGAATLAITEALHDGKTIYITKTDGLAITLPVPVAGMKFRFVIGATIASASTIKSVAGTHLMVGHALMGNNSDNTVVLWQATAADTFDTIDLLGTSNSTGGIEGQVITIEAMSSTLWFVEIVGDAAGTEATPFANTVT